MDQPTEEWERRCTELWQQVEALAGDKLRSAVDSLAGELPREHPVAAFERACAWDSTGHSDRAVPLYRQALAGGLHGLRRRRATIQLASSLRNVGAPGEALYLLQIELAQPPDELTSAVCAFAALALADLGREREALRTVLLALASHLPRYSRSVTNYANDLVSSTEPNNGTSP